MEYREFCETYLPLGDSLYRVACYLLDPEDAEDALQDLYVKLWNSRDALDAVRNPKAYCITMMKNLCVERIRKASRAGTAPMPDDACSGIETDASIRTREQLARIGDAIGHLPESQRKVLEMKTLEGMSYQEIAERTGMSCLSLRVMLSKARNNIKKWL